MAGRKNFVAGEILTASDVNSFLMDQSVMVFDDSAARGSAIPSPTEGMVTYRKDEKTVEVFDGSAFGPIGKILQVVNNTTDTQVTVTSSTFQSTGLTATITPSSTSNKIIVIAHSAFSATAGGVPAFGTIFRGTTGGVNLGNGVEGFGRLVILAPNEVNAPVSFNVVDSPNTTSAQTYTLAIRSSTTTAVRAQQSNARASMTLLEVAG